VVNMSPGQYFHRQLVLLDDVKLVSDYCVSMIVLLSRHFKSFILYVTKSMLCRFDKPQIYKDGSISILDHYSLTRVLFENS